MGVLDTLQAATPVRRTVVMCVDGALQAEWDAANEALDDAARSDIDDGSLALPKTKRAVDHLDDLRDRVAASKVSFLFERVDWTERLAEMAKHPPREGVLLDRMNGYNVETFTRWQIAASCVSATGVDGDTSGIPAETWVTLLGASAEGDKPKVAGTMNSKQIERLTTAARHVNEGENSVPPSARSLLESQDSGASLAQPSPGTSPQDGSEAGSPRGSRKSSTTKKARTSQGSHAAS